MSTDLNIEGLTNPSNSTYLLSNRIPYVSLDTSKDRSVLTSLGYNVNNSIYLSTEYNTPYLPMFFGLLTDSVPKYKVLLENKEFDFNFTEKAIGFTSSILDENLLLSDNFLIKDTTTRNNLILADEGKSYNPLLGIFNSEDGNGTNKFLEVLKTRSALVLSTFASRPETLFSDLIKETVDNLITANNEYPLNPLDITMFLRPVDGEFYIPTERFNLHYVNYDSFLTLNGTPVTHKDTLTIVNALCKDNQYTHYHPVTNNPVGPFRTPLRLNKSTDSYSYNTLELLEGEEYRDIESSNEENMVDDVYKAYREGKYRYSLDSSKSVLFLSSRYGEITNTTYCPNKDYDLSLKDDLYFAIDYFEDIRGNSNVVRDVTHYLTLQKFYKPSKEKEERFKNLPKEPKFFNKIRVTKEMVTEVTRKYK